MNGPGWESKISSAHNNWYAWIETIRNQQWLFHKSNDYFLSRRNISLGLDLYNSWVCCCCGWVPPSGEGAVFHTDLLDTYTGSGLEKDSSWWLNFHLLSRSLTWQKTLSCLKLDRAKNTSVPVRRLILYVVVQHWSQAAWDMFLKTSCC